MSKQYYQKMLSEGRTKKLIQKLLSSETLKNSEYYDEIIQQSSRFEEIEKEKRQGTIENEHYTLQLNKINVALNEIIKKLENDSESESVRLFPVNRYNTFQIAIPIALILLITYFSVSYLVDKEDAFYLSIKIQDNKPSEFYPDIPENSKLLIWYNDQWLPSEIRNNVADFKKLNADIIGKTTTMRLESQYWKITNPNIKISKENNEVQLEPDNSLGNLKLRVVDSKSRKPLSDVELEIDTIKTISNEDGWTDFNIPYKLQKQVYRVRYKLNGLIRERNIYLPQDKIELDIP